MPFYNQQIDTNKVDGEKYLNMAITGIIELPSKMLTDNPNAKANDFISMRRVLINQLEALAIATGKIKLVDRTTGFEIDEYTEAQKELKKHLVEYFRANDAELGIGAEPKAKQVLRFIIEGEYVTKLDLFEEKINKLVSENKLNDEEKKDRLADFKFSEIVSAAVASKIKRVELDG
jgi:hypothetical protein